MDGGTLLPEVKSTEQSRTEYLHKTRALDSPKSMMPTAVFYAVGVMAKIKVEGRGQTCLLCVCDKVSPNHPQQTSGYTH